jgi:hypothetical protein
MGWRTTRYGPVETTACSGSTPTVTDANRFSRTTRKMRNAPVATTTKAAHVAPVGTRDQPRRRSRPAVTNMASATKRSVSIATICTNSVSRFDEEPALE